MGGGTDTKPSQLSLQNPSLTTRKQMLKHRFGLLIKIHKWADLGYREINMQ